MEFLYEVGILKVFKEDNNSFTVYSSTIPKPHLPVIGSYINKNGEVQRIRRDSLWGKKILELCVDAPPIELSEPQKRLAELIAGIGIGPGCV